jgi:hypothetical protein
MPFLAPTETACHSGETDSSHLAPLQHKRFHLHFTPTSASWLNMVERFFRDISEKQISRGVFHSVAQLEQVIGQAIEHHNSAPKPFIWTATASDILEKVTHARKTLNKVASA